MKNNNNLNPLTVLHNRLAKIRIEVTFAGNYPWVYLDIINGKKVKETTSDSNHGFNIAWLPIAKDKSLYLTNTKEMFKLIRKYLDNEKNNDRMF